MGIFDNINFYLKTAVVTFLGDLKKVGLLFKSIISGQSYKTSTIVIYDSRVIPDWKILHITTLES